MAMRKELIIIVSESLPKKVELSVLTTKIPNWKEWDSEAWVREIRVGELININSRSLEFSGFDAESHSFLVKVSVPSLLDNEAVISAPKLSWAPLSMRQ